MNEIADDLVIKGMRRFFKNLKEPGHRVLKGKDDERYQDAHEDLQRFYDDMVAFFEIVENATDEYRVVFFFDN